MTCRRPVTAMQPFARSSAISWRRGTGRTLCHTGSRMPWAQSLMPRRFPRSNRRPRYWASPVSYRALHRKRRHAGWSRRRCSRGNAKHADRRDWYRRRTRAGASRGVAFAREASDLLDVPFDEATVEVVAGHAGPAYGVPHEATIEAIRLAGQLEALPLDPVYSGKGLAGLIARSAKGVGAKTRMSSSCTRRRAGAFRLPERTRHLNGEAKVTEDGPAFVRFILVDQRSQTEHWSITTSMHSTFAMHEIPIIWRAPKVRYRARKQRRHEQFTKTWERDLVRCVQRPAAPYHGSTNSIRFELGP